MSLTLPSAYSSTVKLGNIEENWVVQLGFFNGDAQGSGEGGWDEALQADARANLLTAGVNTSTTTFPVDDGTVFTAGDYIKVESEIVKITSISSNDLTVVRTRMGTSAEAHENNDAIYWNNFFPIALIDTKIDDVFYHGAIIKNPTIRSSIDLAKSTARTGNISLSVVNFKHEGDDFSAELLFGTRKYINREVRIYSQLNTGGSGGVEGTPDAAVGILSNCLQIYSGRLIDISHNDSQISLQLTEQRPWDFLTIPQDRTVLSGNQRGTAMYFPVAYGDFSANVSTQSAPALCYPEISGQSANLFPIPVHRYDSTRFFCLMPGEDTGNSANNANSCTPHWYEKNIDSFIPLLNSSGNTYDDNTESYMGGNAIQAPLNLYRSFKFKPDTLGGGNEFTTNPNNMFDTANGASSTALDTSTTGQYAAQTDTPSASTASTETDTLDAITNIPQIDGKVTYVTVSARGYSSINATASDGTLSCGMQMDDLDGSFTTMASNSTSGTSLQSLGYDNSTAGAGNHTTSDLSANLTANDSEGMLPSTFTIRHNLIWNWGNSNDGKSGNYITGFVGDIHFTVRTKLSFDTNDITGSIEKLNKVERMYTGGDGLSASYTGGSGVADTGLEAHRDMLFRYAGWDDTDANIYNWASGLDVEDNRIDSSTWNIAWWALKPIELKKVLEQIQYEFGFIFKFRHDGTGSYWIVKDSYSSGDVVQTLTKHDINNLSISNTPFSDLLTKMDIEYKQHPADEGRFLLNLTAEDTTNDPRSVWNIQAKENIQQVKLEMNVNKPGNANPGGGDPNDGFADYYMNIFGDVKKIINCDIVNPAKGYNLETGDIIKFSSNAGEMIVEPFGDNWADYYMITDIQRSPGKITIQCREVG